MYLNKSNLLMSEETSIETSITKRATVQTIDQMLGKQIPILDHGFIRVIDYMGSDDSIVQAARISYGKGTKRKQDDQNLINYLMRHKHTTPFEMCEIKLHIKMPIFVARQWIRHRSANVNEYSARYSIMSDDYYVPKSENISVQSLTNKQGRETAGLDSDQAENIINKIKNFSQQGLELYKELLNQDSLGNLIDPSKPNLSKELARIILGVNFYTEMYWKIDLHNLLHFLHLRASDHAQYEIQVYAKCIEDIIKIWTPISYEAYKNYRKNNVSIQKSAFDAITSNTDKKNAIETLASLNMSKRELNELIDMLKD